MKKLTGMLVYVSVDKAIPCYDKEKGKEYKAGVVVDEDTADAFAEIFTKQPARKVKRSEFEKEYKCKPPEGTEKNLYVITLRKNEKLANGNPIPDLYRPKVYLQTDKGRNEITTTTLVGNGSYGTISIDRYDNDYGSNARLQNILVTDLVEYERTASYEPGSEFDDDNADDGEGNNVKVPAKAKGKAAKPAAKPEDEFEEDDVPF
jgi:hypothetical protein